MFMNGQREVELAEGARGMGRDWPRSRCPLWSMLRNSSVTENSLKSCQVERGPGDAWGAQARSRHWRGGLAVTLCSLQR